MTKKRYSYWENRHLEHVKNLTAKAIREFGMIEEGDKVLVAVSGGKDSLVLLDAIAGFRKFGIVDFSIEAIHIDVADVPYSVNRNYLEKYCNELDVPFRFETIEADIERRGKKAPCFVCSWHRRKTLFSYAKNNGFKKLALGHHMDDAVETLLVNMAYHGNISSLPGKLKMFDGMLWLIRPLILLRDSDTRKYAGIRGFELTEEECPYADTTSRTVARNLLEEMKRLHPKAVENMFRSMSRIDDEYLPKL